MVATRLKVVVSSFCLYDVRIPLRGTSLDAVYHFDLISKHSHCHPPGSCLLWTHIPPTHCVPLHLHISACAFL